jgi:hypothetical protein
MLALPMHYDAAVGSEVNALSSVSNDCCTDEELASGSSYLRIFRNFSV